MKQLKNEKGNTTIFIISLFGVFLLMFMVIFSAANVFIEKQHASNNAEQASIVASGIVLDSLEEAISDYDSWLILKLAEIPVDPAVEDLEPLGDRVQSVMNSLPNKYTKLEKKHLAVNQVVRDELNSGNPFFSSYVSGELGSAEASIIFEVTNNIADNSGVVSGTKIKLNSDHRIEVETSIKNKALLIDKDITLKQKGKGPTFEFAEAMGWNLSIEL